jgi:hypothetical protein
MPGRLRQAESLFWRMFLYRRNFTYCFVSKQFIWHSPADWLSFSGADLQIIESFASSTFADRKSVV